MFFWSDWGSRPPAQAVPMSFLPFAPILQQPQSQKVSLLDVRRKSYSDKNNYIFNVTCIIKYSELFTICAY